jgi:hypothetical protein
VTHFLKEHLYWYAAPLVCNESPWPLQIYHQLKRHPLYEVYNYMTMTISIFSTGTIKYQPWGGEL